MSKVNTETVKVMVRIRPMNKSELIKGSTSVVNVDSKNSLIELKHTTDSSAPVKNFTYDSVYDTDSL
jgi:hypothetical protein